MRTLILLLYCLMVFAYKGKAQALKDTLKDAHIKGKKTSLASPEKSAFATGQAKYELDSQAMVRQGTQSIAEIIARQLPVMVKQYSLNGLATLQLRGSSAAQSMVMWEGIPIQNAALGITDLATIPGFFISRATLQYGSSGAMWGSGNTGGALQLQADIPYYDTLKHIHTSLSTAVGSFGSLATGIKLVYSKRSLFISSGVFASQAHNELKYVNDSGTRSTLPHAYTSNKTFALTLAKQFSTASSLKLSAWVQHYFRELPPALQEIASGKQQNNITQRIAAEWRHQRLKHAFALKGGYIADVINYSDNAIALYSRSPSHQWFAEASYSYKWHKHTRLLLFTPMQWSAMYRPSDSTLKQQQKIALAAALSHNFWDSGLTISAQLRAEKADNTSYTLPGISASYRCSKYLSLQASLQSTYRVPYLNELYFFPGGNTLLKPEKGYSAEAGYQCDYPYRKWHFSHRLQYYNRTVSDWIIWLGGAVWTPRNIAKVFSRGVETDNAIIFGNPAHKAITLRCHTAYNLSTVVASDLPQDGSVGKQLPYTPRYIATTSLEVQYLPVNFAVHTRYTGYSFTVADEAAYIEPYFLTDLTADYAVLSTASHSLHLYAQCLNLFNASYTIIANRPMPGKHYLLSARWEL